MGGLRPCWEINVGFPLPKIHVCSPAMTIFLCRYISIRMRCLVAILLMGMKTCNRLVLIISIVTPTDYLFVMGISGLNGLLKFGQNNNIHRNVEVIGKVCGGEIREIVGWRKPGWGAPAAGTVWREKPVVSTDLILGGKKNKQKDSRESEALFPKTEQVPKSILVPTKKKKSQPTRYAFSCHQSFPNRFLSPSP